MAVLEHLKFDLIRSQKQDRRQKLEVQLQVPGGKSYTLQSNGEIVAFGQHWALEVPSVHLGRLIVSPTHRGNGFGRELCCQLIAAAKENTGASSVTLRVYKHNEVALALYHSLGFRQLAACRTYQ